MRAIAIFDSYTITAQSYSGWFDILMLLDLCRGL